MPSGTFFPESCMQPWTRSLSNILPKRSLREDFLAQNPILSAQRAPAGRLPDLRHIKKYVSWYLFRLWYMQFEAFRYITSFEHSPKPLKHPNYIVFNDSYVEKCKRRKYVANQLWPVQQYVNKYAELKSAIRSGWNLLKWRVFDDSHFWHFLYFCSFVIF